MSEQPKSKKKNTTADAFKGTSAVQHVEPDEKLFRKTSNTAKAGEIGIADIGSTNATSMFWGMHFIRAHGTQARNFGFPGQVQVFANSQVSVTITEVARNGIPFLGAATMQIFNVVPQDDGTITVKFNVDWSDELDLLFNFIIVN